MTGFGEFSGYTAPVEEDVINLAMGVETTGGLAGTLLPEGTHKFWVHSKPEIGHSNGGEILINLPCRVVESNVPEAVGQEYTERMTIPGEMRKENEPGKWKTMMKFLRVRLEALTGREWREDNLQLKPSELTGAYFIATCVHKDSEPVAQAEGPPKIYKNPNLINWQHVHAGANGAAAAFDQPAAAPATSTPTPAAGGGFVPSFGPTPQAATGVYDPANEPF